MNTQKHKPFRLQPTVQVLVNTFLNDFKPIVLNQKYRVSLTWDETKADPPPKVDFLSQRTCE